MSDKQPHGLAAVPETMLIPLYGRAVESAKPRPLLRDPRAREIVDRLDYDFAKFDRAPSLLGSVIRTLLFDGWVRRFLHHHPTGTVVELGTGLNTRFERLDNGRAHWVELDLPDAIALRRRFFPDTPRHFSVAASMTDAAWHATVRALPGPHFFVAEASLVYLPTPDAEAVVRALVSGFDDMWLCTDTCGRAFVDHQDRHDVMRLMTARIGWRCDDPAAFAARVPGLELRDRYSMGRLPAGLRRRLPPVLRAVLPVAGRLVPGSRAYRMCLFGPPEDGGRSQLSRSSSP